MNRAFQRGQAHEAKLREVLGQEAKIVPGGLRALMRDLTGVPLPKFAHYYETLDKWKNLSKGIYANTAAELVYKCRHLSILPSTLISYATDHA
ncbi:hypothetical protein PLESTB_000555500 [Pleodorina starrii]|uniref:Uncharacterized protein n=1 Tax=Pleodorina starrii TaxID=330485 RepID=A0A9W6F0H9_9CHLO|nr:hypothetical protein PLESTB_000555500 [Pleodorina starrii]GLC74533.1 hypothetical protein PLESTF_001524300 [Pleodorina starrii]